MGVQAAGGLCNCISLTQMFPSSPALQQQGARRGSPHAHSFIVTSAPLPLPPPLSTEPGSRRREGTGASREDKATQVHARGIRRLDGRMRGGIQGDAVSIYGWMSVRYGNMNMRAATRGAKQRARSHHVLGV